MAFGRWNTTELFPKLPGCLKYHDASVTTVSGLESWSSTLWHRDLCSMPCGSLDGRRVWERMGTYIYMAEYFCSPPETITKIVNWSNGLPWWLSWERVSLRYRRPRLHPWVGKIPWRKKRQPTPVFLPTESPWTEEPNRLQSIGSHRVGHNWVTNTSLIFQYKIKLKKKKKKTVGPGEATNSTLKGCKN